MTGLFILKNKPAKPMVVHRSSIFLFVLWTSWQPSFSPSALCCILQGGCFFVVVSFFFFFSSSDSFRLWEGWWKLTFRAWRDGYLEKNGWYALTLQPLGSLPAWYFHHCAWWYLMPWLTPDMLVPWPSPTAVFAQHITWWDLVPALWVLL